MPNRIIREGILTSDRVNRLSPQAEVFYRRLMSVVDDYGAFDGRISIIRAACYAAKLDTVSNDSICAWLDECVKERLLYPYQVNGKPYVYFPNLGEPRAKKSKYPPPPQEIIEKASEIICAQMNADESIGNHLRADESIGNHLQANVPPYALRLSPTPIEVTDSTPDGVACPQDQPAPAKRRRVDTSAVGQLRDVFKSNWRSVYGVDYVWNHGKEDAQIKTLVHQIGMEEAKSVIRRYLEDTDPWVAERRHPLGLIFSRLNRYRGTPPDQPEPNGFVRTPLTQEDLELFGGKPESIRPEDIESVRRELGIVDRNAA